MLIRRHFSQHEANYLFFFCFSFFFVVAVVVVVDMILLGTCMPVPGVLLETDKLFFNKVYLSCIKNTYFCCLTVYTTTVLQYHGGFFKVLSCFFFSPPHLLPVVTTIVSLDHLKSRGIFLVMMMIFFLQWQW